MPRSCLDPSSTYKMYPPSLVPMLSCGAFLHRTAAILDMGRPQRCFLVPHNTVNRKYPSRHVPLAQDELSSKPVAPSVLCLPGLGMLPLHAAPPCFSGMRFGYGEHWEFITQKKQ